MLAFTTVGPILHLTQAYAQWSREQNRKILAHLGEANGAATEALANVRTVKAMATEEAEAARCRTASKAPSWRSPFWLIPFVAAASPRPGAADCHTPPGRAASPSQCPELDGRLHRSVSRGSLRSVSRGSLRRGRRRARTNVVTQVPDARRRRARPRRRRRGVERRDAAREQHLGLRRGLAHPFLRRRRGDARRFWAFRGQACDVSVVLHENPELVQHAHWSSFLLHARVRRRAARARVVAEHAWRWWWRRAAAAARGDARRAPRLRRRLLQLRVAAREGRAPRPDVGRARGLDARAGGTERRGQDDGAPHAAAVLRADRRRDQDRRRGATDARRAAFAAPVRHRRAGDAAF